MKRLAGFTLVELAVVVFLIGLIATMGITSLKAQLASAAISNTKKKQDTIKDALIAYLGRNKRLPCPAVAITGSESRSTPQPNCTTYIGIVPYVELGLPKSAALDGWENFFTYAVSQQWTATLSTTTTATTTTDPTKAFNTGNLGLLTVNDRIPTTQNPPTVIANPTTPPPLGAVVVLISHGKNGLGAYTAKGTQNMAPTSGTDESANALPPNPLPLAATVIFPPAGFFQREYTEIVDTALNPYGAFDDVLQWLSASDFITPLMKDGSLKSAESQWADQVANIKNALVAYILTNQISGTLNCAPPLNTGSQFSNLILTPNTIPATDPWGHSIEYVQCVRRIHKDATTDQANNIPGTPFFNKSTGLNQTYSNYCTSPGQLAFAITAITDSTTNPITKLPVPTPSVSTLLGANSNFMSNNCPP